MKAADKALYAKFGIDCSGNPLFRCMGLSGFFKKEAQAVIESVKATKPEPSQLLRKMERAFLDRLARLP